MFYSFDVFDINETRIFCCNCEPKLLWNCCAIFRSNEGFSTAVSLYAASLLIRFVDLAHNKSKTSDYSCCVTVINWRYSILSYHYRRLLLIASRVEIDDPLQIFQSLNWISIQVVWWAVLSKTTYTNRSWKSLILSLTYHNIDNVEQKRIQ